MAIVKMRHVDMLALEQDQKALMAAIQKMGCFQLLPSDSESVAFHRSSPAETLSALGEQIARISWSIGKLSHYDQTKSPLMADKPSIDETTVEQTLTDEARLMRTVERLEELERETGDLRGQAARTQAAKEQLLPWQTFPLPFAQVQSTRNTVAMLGTLQKSALERWILQGTLPELCTVETVSVQRDLASVYVLMHRSCRDEMTALFKEANFVPFQAQGVSSTAEEELARLNDVSVSLEQKQRDLAAETASLSTDIKPLKNLHDILSSKRDRLDAAGNTLQSQRTFFLQGWIPDTMEKKAEAKLQAVSPSASITFYDALEGEDPPVLLHNAPMVSPFETVVSNFSLPASSSIDPTFVMMPFFINFMGMMVSDAGYGLMMALLAPILIKVLKPSPGAKRLLWIIMGGGIMTVFWGAMYNTWFGFAPFPSVFDPMNNALPVMATCIGLGAIHLFAGLGMAAYMNIRRGNYLDMIFDQLSWFLLVIGLVLLTFRPEIGQWMALVGAGIIVLTAGRSKSKNPIKRLISGLGALYGITSWVSDLLSYIRLFGMGLATGVIGMVINILVGMVVGFGPVGIVLSAFVFVGGHLFNAGINIFGAYVHSCRLQYIEFFGKFFEDGGKPFKPLAENGRYVYIREAQPRA